MDPEFNCIKLPCTLALYPVLPSNTRDGRQAKGAGSELAPAEQHCAAAKRVGDGKGSAWRDRRPSGLEGPKAADLFQG